MTGDEGCARNDCEAPLLQEGAHLDKGVVVVPVAVDGDDDRRSVMSLEKHRAVAAQCGDEASVHRHGEDKKIVMGDVHHPSLFPPQPVRGDCRQADGGAYRPGVRSGGPAGAEMYVVDCHDTDSTTWAGHVSGASYVTSRENRVMAESRDRLLLWRSGYTT